MGCLRDHDADTATAKVAGCVGYELTRDLDFDTDGDGATYTTSSTGVVTGDSGDTYYNAGAGWNPIGNSTNRFTATFDGNDKAISNLFIKSTGSNSFGLFGTVGTGGRVERLGVRDVSVAGSGKAGGLVGSNSGAISDSHATGSVTTTGYYYYSFAGGLVGQNAGTISDSYATGSVTGFYSGGLVGRNSGTISASYATGSVGRTGSASARSAIGSGQGGVVSGNFSQSTVNAIYWNIASYATGSATVTGQYDIEEVGGLVGSNSGTINTSYATGSVTTGNYGYVGGLVGYSNGTISASYATGSVRTGNNGHAGGLVGSNSVTINTSYATGSVTTGNYGYSGGLVGYNGSGTINASYATGSVRTGNNGHAGGLVGYNNGTINANYATGSAIGGSYYSYVGGLVGYNYDTISASYATGSATGGSSSNVGGLVGYNYDTISASYATGSATGGSSSNVGGLVGAGSSSRVTASYWDTGTTGQSTSVGGASKTTRELQWPTGYSGIYAAWNTNLDGVAGNDDPWDFGTNGQYPALRYGGLVPAQQRPVSVSTQSVNGNIPIVGGPVTASIDATGATGITWQWQSSTDGSAWTDIANATGATYIPVAADAASGGKFLRARVSFTAGGESQTLTTHRTAKVVSNATVSVIAATSAPIVGEKLRYYLSAAGATHRTAWQWRRCDDAAMTTNCVLRAQSNAASDAHTEYTPVAGTDTDVGKYLQAHAYYAANDAGKTWTRTETPILGPVVAAPTASP